jgi:hypothetical protein
VLEAHLPPLRAPPPLACSLHHLCSPLPSLSSFSPHLRACLAARRSRPQVDNNVSKNGQLLDVIAANQSIFKNNYGYQEWRRACEVRPLQAARHAAEMFPRCPASLGCPPAVLLLAPPAPPHPPTPLAHKPACPRAPPPPPLQSASSGIRASIKGYKDLRDNLGEGLRFYMGLQVGRLAGVGGGASVCVCGGGGGG